MTVRIGVLNDMPSAETDDVLEHAVTLGVQDVRGTRPGASLPDIDLVVVAAAAHPVGSPDLAATALRSLAETGVVAVIGPAVSDNALACQPVANDLQLPCINWSGSEETRSEWMFHYQVGSLEDEPFVIAEHLADRGGRRVAVVREDSIIGRRYASFFDDAAVTHGLEILGVIDVDVRGANGADAAAAVNRLAPDAVAYFGFPSAAGVAVAMSGASVPVAANSALLMGHSDPELASVVDGWCYVDVFHEANREQQRFQTLWPDAPPLSAALFDMARLVALGLVHAPSHDGVGMRAGLERVKRVPAAIGAPGTVAGFGRWKRSALEGGYLVLRQWRGGQSVLVERAATSG